MMRYTQLKKSPVVDRIENVKAAIRLIEGLTVWRHHNTGMLQSYVQESDDGYGKETRVHIWHPDLVTSEPWRQVHDHRFDFESSIICGSMYHEEYTLHASTVGTHHRFEVVNARKGMETQPDPTPMDGQFLVQRETFVLYPGDVYRFKAREFHRSWTTELCVSVLTKMPTEDRGQAQILTPVERTPQFGVTPNVTEDIVRQYKVLAVQKLMEMGDALTKATS